MTEITITLPDGSTREHDAAASPPARSRPSIGRGLGQGRARGRRRRSTATGTTWTGRSTHDARVAIVTPDTDDGREVLRHSTAHVMAQAVTDLFPGAKYAIGPAIDDGFYYDFELPGGAHFTDDDLERIEARMREIVEGRRAVRARGGRPRRRRSRSSPTSRTSSRSSSGSTPTTARRSATGTRDLGVPQPARRRRPTFVDLCRGPHVPSTKRLGAFKLHEGRGRVLARRREAPDAPAHLRHRVGVEGGARRAPAPARGGREARPPQARRRARPVLVPRGDRLRPRGLPPEGRHASAGVMEDYSRAAPRGRRLRVRQLAAHHEVEPVRDLGSPRLVRRRHVPADGARRRQPSTTSSR